jgi:hypothetical protein
MQGVVTYFVAFGLPSSQSSLSAMSSSAFFFLPITALFAQTIRRRACIA